MKSIKIEKEEAFIINRGRGTSNVVVFSNKFNTAAAAMTISKALFEL